MKEKINYIKELAEDLCYIQLSQKCGKYYAVTYDDVSVVVLYFVGKNGYDGTELENLSNKVINTIYEDLFNDFGEQ